MATKNFYVTENSPVLGFFKKRKTRQVDGESLSFGPKTLQWKQKGKKVASKFPCATVWTSFNSISSLFDENDAVLRSLFPVENVHWDFCRWHDGGIVKEVWFWLSSWVKNMNTFWQFPSIKIPTEPINWQGFFLLFTTSRELLIETLVEEVKPWFWELSYWIFWFVETNGSCCRLRFFITATEGQNRIFFSRIVFLKRRTGFQFLNPKRQFWIFMCLKTKFFSHSWLFCHSEC